MFSSLYHISGEVVKDELDEMPKESQAQNGLENSEKGKKKKLRITELKSSLKRHGEEGSWWAVPDQPGDKDWSTIVHGESGKCKAKAFKMRRKSLFTKRKRKQSQIHIKHIKDHLVCQFV